MMTAVGSLHSPLSIHWSDMLSILLVRLKPCFLERMFKEAISQVPKKRNNRFESCRTKQPRGDFSIQLCPVPWHLPSTPTEWIQSALSSKWNNAFLIECWKKQSHSCIDNLANHEQAFPILGHGAFSVWQRLVTTLCETYNPSPHVSASSHPVARPFSLGHFQGALLREEKWWQQWFSSVGEYHPKTTQIFATVIKKSKTNEASKSNWRTCYLWCKTHNKISKMFQKKACSVYLEPISLQCLRFLFVSQ